MDLATLRSYYRQCNPDEALDPDDPRNVALGSQVRGRDWAAAIARQIELSDPTPVCRFFTGLRGTGKSTELRRLAALLRGGPSKLFPVIVDGEELLDITSTLDVPDVLAALLAGTERAVLLEEGHDADDALQEGVGARLWNWLTRTDLELRSEVGPAGVGKLVSEMKTRPTVRQRVRKVVQDHLTSFLQEVREQFLLLQERLRKRGWSGLVVILDSVEKLQGMSSSWQQVLDSAERIFGNDAPYLRLPVHVLYTIPPSLVTRLRVDVHFLPMIKLQERNGAHFEPGYAAAREIIRHRVPDAILSEILGPTSAQVWTRELIRWSGGYPRDLMRLLRAVMEVDAPAFTQSVFDGVLRSAGDTYVRVVQASGVTDWLARVAVEKALLTGTDAERAAADRMLGANVVLRYMNDAQWFDLHPAVREIPQVQVAIERIEEGRRGERGT
ncbi:MAG: hypothetical protein U0324_24100 [Polyangiales bacterium]